MSYYGVGGGWCFSCGGFAGHVKLMFINGAALEPVPPVTPVGMGKATRGVELESVDDLDKRQLAAWMTQVASVRGAGAKSVEPKARRRCKQSLERNDTRVEPFQESMKGVICVPPRSLLLSWVFSRWSLRSKPATETQLIPNSEQTLGIFGLR